MLRTVSALLVGSSAAFSLQGAVRPANVRATMVAPAEAPASPLTDIWKSGSSVRVEGQTLKTWDLKGDDTQRVQLSIKSSGRPVDANIELWHTPSYIPTKFRVYTEDGNVRPVDAIIETPKHPKTVACYNMGQMEFPFDAAVANTGLSKAYESGFADVQPELVQGAGTIKSYHFGAETESVQVLLKTDERNMKAKIELTQGPNQVKQVIELYASVGYKNPFYCVIQTPGPMNTIRVINQNTVEFPFDAWVIPYETSGADASQPVMGGTGVLR